MRSRQVWKYYCDFCKKSGCSKFHLAKHEERCTNNPNRVCGMCRVMDNKQKPLADLIALLPAVTPVPNGYGDMVFDDTAHKAVDDAMFKLRSISGGCPCCILAALRQSKIPVPMVSSFSFSDECAAIWKGINEEPPYGYLQ